MEISTTAPARRVGRPCAVCALAPQQRLSVETALASGTSISRISRQDWAPGRDSIRHHLDSGHLRADLQERAERATGLDHTSLAARISDIAERARTAALEAAEAGDRAGVLKAGDSELRALAALTSAGESSEREIALGKAYRDMSVAVLRVARRDGTTAEIIAAELDVMHRSDVADDIREQFPEMKEVSA